MSGNPPYHKWNHFHLARSPLFAETGVPSKLVFSAHDLIVCGAPRQTAFLGGQLQGFLAVELGLPDELFDAVGKTLRGICLGARVGGRFGADQERNFAACGAFVEGSGEFGKFAAADFFVQLCHFARDARAAIAENLPGVANTLRDSLRSFVKDDGAVLDAQAFEGAAAFAAARRQEADEQEFFVGQARGGKGSEQRGRAGNRHHGNLVPQAERNEAVARVGHERRPRVAHQRDLCALLKRHDQFRRAGQLIVFVVADERFVNVVVSEELQRVARVLAGNFIDFLEDAQRAQRDVFEIADRRTDKIKAAAVRRINRVCRIGGVCQLGGRSLLRAHAHESSTRSGRATRARTLEQCYTLSFEYHIGGASVPLYEYKCLKCGRNTEKIENVSGPHLKKCPHCGGKVESVITAPSIQFKGAGWYVTDYGGKKPGAGSSDGEKSDKPAADAKESGSKDKDSGSKETASKDTKESKDKKPAKKSNTSEK